MSKYSSQGWHFQSKRHSNARKYGKAGGKYSQPPVLKPKQLKSADVGSLRPKSRIDAMFDFEMMNPNFMEDEMDGLIRELKGERDTAYMREKMNNIRHHFIWTFDNFAKRIKDPRLQKGFIEQVKGKNWKDDMKPEERKFGNMDLMFKWEDMNPDYMDSQMQGIILEIQKPKEYQHDEYIDEKIRNIKSQFNYTFDNFERRINNKQFPELKDEFLKFIAQHRK